MTDKPILEKTPKPELSETYTSAEKPEAYKAAVTVEQFTQDVTAQCWQWANDPANLPEHAHSPFSLASMVIKKDSKLLAAFVRDDLLNLFEDLNESREIAPQIHAIHAEREPKHAAEYD